MIAMHTDKSTPTTSIVTNRMNCPSEETLRQYLDGSTQEAIGSEIDAHIESCSDCNEALEKLESTRFPRLELRAVPSPFAASEPVSQEEELIKQAIAAAQKQTLLKTDTHIGPYRLVRCIGRGGMGAVYEAEHTKLKRSFALKILPLQNASSHAIDRFEREITAAGKLVHPSIVLSTDAGNHGNNLYLAMELIDGWDLAILTRKLGPLPLSIVCEMGRQVAIALAHAHNHGMVHRDIKPSNIMLDRRGHIKLMDFGLVMFEPWNSPVGELTTVGQFLGTLDYMAPEQAERSGQVDFRSDLYSLGATMFKQLTGHLPLAMYPNQSPIEKLRALAEHKPISLRTLRAEIPESLCALIDQMLATDPKSRPKSAAHVAEALAPFCQNADLKIWTEQLNPALLIEDSVCEPSIAPQLLNPGTRLDIEKSSTSFLGGHLGWIVWMAAALLPFGAWLGISMILQDQDGNLVIESESADVRVRLLKGEQVVREISVQSGNSLTKLRSGQYEITIDAPSDAFTIDQSTLVLKQGETVIARIKKLPTKDKTLGTSSSATEDATKQVLRQLGIAESTLAATYEGKELTEYIRVMQTERDLKSWKKCVLTVQKALSKEDREKMKPMVQSAARDRVSMMSISDWIDMRHWFDNQEIDTGIRKRLEDAPGRFLDGLHELFQAITRKDFTSATDLKQSLEYIEGKLLNLTVKELNPNIDLGLHPISDELFRLYPMTAFATCQYYEKNNFGTSGSVVTDAARHTIRLQSKLKLSKLLYSKKDYEKWLWLVSRTNPIYQGVPGVPSPESDFWELVASQIVDFLTDWQQQSTVIPETWVAPQFGTMDLNNAWGGSSVSSWGISSFSQSKVSIGIEVLRICERLPKSMRPILQLEAVAKMVSTKPSLTTSQRKDLALRPWSSLQWDDEGRLQLFDSENTKMTSDYRSAMESMVIQRWIDGLCRSDMRSPNEVANLFFGILTKKEGYSTVPGGIRSLICSRGRVEWSTESTLKSIPRVGEKWFEPNRIETFMDRCIILGEFKAAGAAGLGEEEFELEFELEPEGWRICRMIRRKEGTADETVFQF